jgi:hypothetical protein
VNDSGEGSENNRTRETLELHTNYLSIRDQNADGKKNSKDHSDKVSGIKRHVSLGSRVKSPLY